MQIHSLILAATAGAILALGVGYASRTHVRLRIIALPLRAAAVSLAVSLAVLLAWPNMEGTRMGTWFSNRSALIQVAFEMLVLVACTVIVLRRLPLRLYPIITVLTLILCLGSLAVTNRVLLLGVMSDAVGATERPLSHGWGVHAPPSRRFFGYAIAVASAAWATLALERRKDAADRARSVRQHPPPG